MAYAKSRGADEIGGICIEVAGDDGTRILLDSIYPCNSLSRARRRIAKCDVCSANPAVTK